MPSLREILRQSAPVLVLDAASSRVQVGLWQATGRGNWLASDEEAGIGVFRLVEALGVPLPQIGAFLYCEGPGSILGIRTVAMALRTWNALQVRPTFSYRSLELVAHALPDENVTVIADARRETWHCFRRGDGLRRVPTAEVVPPAVTPEHFRHWSALPAGTSTTPYNVADLLECCPDADLFRTSALPDAYLHEDPAYVTWAPQIHRPPTAVR